MTQHQIDDLPDDRLFELIERLLREANRRLAFVEEKITKNISSTTGIDEITKMLIPSDRWVKITDLASEIGRYVYGRYASPQNVLASVTRLHESGEVKKNGNFVQRND